MASERNAENAAAEGTLARYGLALARWSERWFPDPLVFALLGIVFVFFTGVALHEPARNLAIQGGKSFWALIPFTMQMVMVIIGGYVLASTPVVYRLIRWLAGVPKTPRSAIALVALLSMLTSLISWGLSLIFSGLFVRELTQRVKGMDYRAAGAAGYLGLGAVWALGLSSSAALLMTTKSAIPPALLAIAGVVPLTQTIFTLAEPGHGGGAAAGFGFRFLFFGALGGKCENRQRLRPGVRAHRYDPRAESQARRMARIQSAADHRRGFAAWLVSGGRVPRFAARRARRP